VVLPGTNQHSPLDRLTSAQGKKEKKNKLNNKQAAEKKRHIAKRVGHPELQRVGEGHSHIQTVNKQAGRSGSPLPATLDEMVIKGKIEELLVKQLKTCERNMQELTDSIKRPNLRIMGIEEG
jgi:hypothetical protein